jgi:hypothetical protein
MSEQTPDQGPGPSTNDRSPLDPAEQHEHVRTDGETGVDDAIGTSDDPAG